MPACGAGDERPYAWRSFAASPGCCSAPGAGEAVRRPGQRQRDRRLLPSAVLGAGAQDIRRRLAPAASSRKTWSRLEKARKLDPVERRSGGQPRRLPVHAEPPRGRRKGLFRSPGAPGKGRGLRQPGAALPPAEPARPTPSSRSRKRSAIDPQLTPALEPMIGYAEKAQAAKEAAEKARQERAGSGRRRAGGARVERNGRFAFQRRFRKRQSRSAGGGSTSAAASARKGSAPRGEGDGYSRYRRRGAAPRSFSGRVKRRECRVGVLGLGYVGLPLGLAFAEAGFPALGFDVDAGKVVALEAGVSYIETMDAERLRGRHRKRGSWPPPPTSTGWASPTSC